MSRWVWNQGTWSHASLGLWRWHPTIHFCNPFTVKVAMVDICLSVGIFPKVGFKWAELFDDADKCLSVCDDCLNLSPWTYRAMMFHCGIDVWIGERCHLIIIKVDEASSKDFPFLEHQFPTEASGHRLQKQILEQFSIRVARDCTLSNKRAQLRM